MGMAVEEQVWSVSGPWQVDRTTWLPCTQSWGGLGEGRLAQRSLLPQQLQLQLDGTQLSDVHHHELRPGCEEVCDVARHSAHQHGAQASELRHLDVRDRTVVSEPSSRAPGPTPGPAPP